MASVKLTDVKKIYDNKVVAVHDFNLRIKDKEFVVFVGPSGCGKSTTLRMIAGLEDISDGIVEIDGIVVNDLQPKDRDIAMVFQNYALYPHMTVYDNIAFSLRLQKMPEDQVYEKVTNAAEILGITEYLTRKPRALSGGQRQRVAIGRAMVRNAKVFLMDEPLSNLDAKLRLEMRSELQRLHLETGSTFVYVTHDQMEAMTLASRICLIDNGVLQQYEEPMLVYNRPNNLFVADFVGNPAVNLMEARGEGDGEKGQLKLLDNYEATFTRVGEMKDLSPLPVPDRKVAKENKDTLFQYTIHRVSDEGVDKDYQPDDNDFVLGIRPEFLSICEDGPIEGEVFSAMPTGMETTVRVRVGNYLLTAVVFGGVIYKLGQKVRLNFKGENVMLFSRKTGRMLCAGRLNVE